MAKKPKTQGTRRARPSATADLASTPVSRQSVILERMEEQQRVVIEAVTMNREALERKLGEFKHELGSRMEGLEFAVRKNSVDIQSLGAETRWASAFVSS